MPNAFIINPDLGSVRFGSNITLQIEQTAIQSGAEFSLAENVKRARFFLPGQDRVLRGFK